MVRNSIALSSLLGIPIYLRNIRSKRPNAGINHQLYGGIKLMKDIT